MRYSFSTQILLFGMLTLLSAFCSGPSSKESGPIAFTQVKGQPFSLSSARRFDVQTIGLPSPFNLSFDINATREAPVLEAAGENTITVRIPRGESPGGHYTLYRVPGKRGTPSDFLGMLSLVEAQTGRVHHSVREMYKTDGSINAYKGKTRQGYDYAYYEFVTEPSDYLIAFALPDGMLLIDGGGYVGFDTIPGSFTCSSHGAK